MVRIGQVEVLELVKNYGTPVWVYDRAVIERRISELEGIATIRYAMKACSNLEILRLMRTRGVLVDCVSEGELRRAADAGYTFGASPAQVVFTCDIFDRTTLAFVVENNIQVNAGSLDMIRQYAAAGGSRPLTLRINPGFGHGSSNKTNTGGPFSKHGIWHEELEAALEVAATLGLEISGLHMHIGSGTNLEHLKKVAQAMTATVRKAGAGIRVLSAGGGLPIPYRSGESRIDLQEYARVWREAKREIESLLGHEIAFECEPGRYLVAEAGTLIAEVRAVKRMGENEFCLIDAGFSELIRPMAYGAYHGISLLGADGVKKSGSNPLVVAGPLCESSDVFTQAEGGVVEARGLGEATVGDLLLLHDVGAYGASMSSNYNSRLYVAEVLVDGESHQPIRSRQTYEQLVVNEKRL